MNLDQFYNAFVNQTMDYDGVYPNQCVDLAKYYLDRVFGVKAGAWGDAHAYFDGEGCRQLQARGWSKVPNNHNDVNQVPPRGALIVWDASLAGSGGGGHIALSWDARPGAATFVSFDENWGGNRAHLVTHNWSKVLGWMVPPSAPAPAPARPAAPAAVPAPTQGVEMIANETQARQAYKLLRPNGSVSDGEIAATAGKRSWAQFANDAQNEVNQRDAALRNQQQHMADMQGTINNQNQVITDLTVKLNDSNATAQEKQKALADALEQIAKDNANMAALHDQIADLNKAVSAGQVVDQSVTDTDSSTLLQRVLAFVLRVKK